jgi:uncharacterized protein YceK
MTLRDPIWQPDGCGGRACAAVRACALALCIGLLAGCASQQQVTVQTETTRTYPPVALVEVLQRPPALPFVRIAVLDASAPAGTPLAQVLAQLQAKAGALGANAIIVQDLSTQQNGAVQYNPSGGNFTTTPGALVPHLRAVAIRLGSVSRQE